MDQRVDLNVPARENNAMLAEIQHAINRVIASGRYILGRECEAFEKEFAAYCGSQHCVGLANGTDAIELSLRAIGVDKTCRVATVANAGSYATTAILLIGAEPVYVDIVQETGLVDVADLVRTLSEVRIDAVVVTHLFGRIADVEKIVALCSAVNVPVVEDCAQAHGARRGGRGAGTFGVAGCFSFYPTKNLGGLGDGGCIITSDSSVAGKLRSLRQYGWNEKYRVVHGGGRNSRLDEIQAAVLRTKLPYLDERNARRRKIAARYVDGITNPSVICPPTGGEENVVHLFVVRSANRDLLRRRLHAEGVGTDIHYPAPDYRQAPVASLKSWSDLPQTEAFVASVLTLPCFPEMTDDEVQSVIDSINRG
jgi:dTDP-4-amino-4,6-dideoxygalactose transaminase